MRDGDDLVHERSLRFPVSPNAMCVAGTHALVNAPSLADNSIVQVVDQNAAEHQSFGTVYRSPNPTVNYRLSQGRLLCIDNEDLVVFAPEGVLGEVRAYGLDGTLRWITEIPPFKPIQIVEEGRRVRVTIPENGFHHIESLTRLPGETMLLQKALSVRDASDLHSAPTTVKRHTYVLKLSTGEGIYVGDGLPLIVAAGASHVITQDEGTNAKGIPYPRLNVHSYPSSGR